jgi:hypothetical protein
LCVPPGEEEDGWGLGVVADFQRVHAAIMR